MKIKALAALCKQSKSIYLYEGDEIQWIGNGAAMYPLHNMPLLNKQNIFIIFDVQESKRNDYLFKNDKLPDGYCFEDIEDGDRMIEREGLLITRMGNTLQPIKTSHGLVFIDTDYLKPVSDVMDTLELYERTTSAGRTYIAIKNGLLLMGIVQLLDIIDKKFVDQMEDITKMCRMAYENKVGEGDQSA